MDAIITNNNESVPIERISTFEIEGTLAQAFRDFGAESPMKAPTERARFLLAIGLAATGFWSKNPDLQVVAGVRVPGGLAVVGSETTAVSSDIDMKE